MSAAKGKRSDVATFLGGDKTRHLFLPLQRKRNITIQIGKKRKRRKGLGKVPNILSFIRRIFAAADAQSHFRQSVAMSEKDLRQ